MPRTLWLVITLAACADRGDSARLPIQCSTPVAKDTLFPADSTYTYTEDPVWFDADGSSNCRITEIHDPGSDDATYALLPDCDDGPTFPCWYLAVDAACSTSGYAAVIVRDTPAPPGTADYVSCLFECDGED